MYMFPAAILGKCHRACLCGELGRGHSTLCWSNGHSSPAGLPKAWCRRMNHCKIHQGKSVMREICAEWHWRFKVSVPWGQPFDCGQTYEAHTTTQDTNTFWLVRLTFFSLPYKGFWWCVSSNSDQCWPDVYSNFYPECSRPKWEGGAESGFSMLFLALPLSHYVTLDQAWSCQGQPALCRWEIGHSGSSIMSVLFLFPACA